MKQIYITPDGHYATVFSRKHPLISCLNIISTDGDDPRCGISHFGHYVSNQVIPVDENLAKLIEQYAKLKLSPCGQRSVEQGIDHVYYCVGTIRGDQYCEIEEFDRLSDARKNRDERPKDKIHNIWEKTVTIEVIE